MHSPCVWIALLLERKGGWLKRGQSSDGVCVGPLGIERNVFGGYDDTAYVDKVVPGAFFFDRDLDICRDCEGYGC